MPNATTITLAEPITFGQETVTELTLQPLKAKHLKGLKLPNGKAESLTIDDLLLLASRLSGRALPVIEELSGEDLMAVLEAVGTFFGIGRRTG